MFQKQRLKNENQNVPHLNHFTKNHDINLTLGYLLWTLVTHQLFENRRVVETYRSVSVDKRHHIYPLSIGGSGPGEEPEPQTLSMETSDLYMNVKNNNNNNLESPQPRGNP